MVEVAATRTTGDYARCTSDLPPLLPACSYALDWPWAAHSTPLEWRRAARARPPGSVSTSLRASQLWSTLRVSSARRMELAEYGLLSGRRAATMGAQAGGLYRIRSLGACKRRRDQDHKVKGFRNVVIR